MKFNNSNNNDSRWKSVNQRLGGVKGVLKIDEGEKKLPRLVQYDMLERDNAEWNQTKKEFAKRYNLKKIVDCKYDLLTLKTKLQSSDD
jgi:hypothetical protein